MGGFPIVIVKATGESRPTETIITLMMEVVSSPETSVTTRLHGVAFQKTATSRDNSTLKG
jgi:hypothetical protein